MRFFCTFLFLSFQLWATGNTCTLTNNAGSACATKTCSLSAIAADTGHANWTGTGCTGNGYVPALDYIVIPALYTLTVNQAWTVGNYGAPVFSYVSSIIASGAVSCTGTALGTSAWNSCSVTCVSLTGGTGSNFIDVYVAANGGSAYMQPDNTSKRYRPWFTASSVTPTLATPTGLTCVTSPVLTAVYQAGGGTPAIDFLGTSSQIVIAAGTTLTVTGDLRLNGTSTIPAFLRAAGSGSTLEFDSSLASPLADGSYPIYSIVGVTNTSAPRTLDFSACPAGATFPFTTCAITSNALGTPGMLVNSQGYGGVTLVAQYTAFSNLGNFLSPAVDSSCGSCNGHGTPVGDWNVSHSTFNNDGLLYIAQSGGAANLVHQYNLHSDALGPGDMLLSNTSSQTTGTRNVSHNVFGAGFNGGFSNSSSTQIAGCNGNGNMASVTYAGNYFADIPCPLNDVATTGNFFRVTWDSVLTTPPVAPVAVNRNHNYFMQDAIAANPHLVGSSYQATTRIAQEVYDVTEDNTVSDLSILLGNTPPASGSIVIGLENSVELYSKQGNSNGWMVALVNLQTSSYMNFALDHNVWLGRQSGTSSNALVTMNHSGLDNMPYVELRSSIMFGLASTTPLKLGTLGTNSGNTNTNYCTNGATIMCDYNAGYQITATQAACSWCTNQGNGYAGIYSGASIPGTGTGTGGHDIDVLFGGTGTTAGNAAANPHFADILRNAALWDTKYLHQSASKGAWAVSTSYTGPIAGLSGDTVSDSHAAIYRNATLNYHCILSHTSAVMSEPDFVATSANGYITQVMIDSGGIGTATTSVNHNLTVGMVINIWGITGQSGNTTQAVYPVLSVPTGATFTFKPGTVTNSHTTTVGLSLTIWRNWWEYASLYDLRNEIFAGTTFSDGALWNCEACTPVQALISWTLAGFATQQPHLWLGGSDGNDIGFITGGLTANAAIQHIPPIAPSF